MGARSWGGKSAVLILQEGRGRSPGDVRVVFGRWWRQEDAEDQVSACLRL